MSEEEKWPEIEKAAAEKRRELVLQGRAINERISSSGGLPSSLYSLRLLNYLEVSQCPSLTEIQEGIQHLTNLQSLILCRNKLTSVPDVIGILKSLKVLDLSANGLKGLPEGITQLKELNTLNVSCNCLEALPDGLSQCTKLATINVSKNQLTALPPDLFSERLDLLSTLVASDNSIHQLSGEIYKLSALKVDFFKTL
ncbi:PREDICTED: leucine-rich repeat-containing protein 47-like, partial [Cyprinodon variegatus]|uniref:leucine-rich repeat-containing protein 47-like n=1 Tax=Cyprinodon variegatus TaxID=28743 RepID=UPI000742537B